MKIYEIDGALAALVDPETGEVAEYETFLTLAMERQKKTEGIALWIKNLRAEIAAIKEEETTLKERRRKAERQAERLEEFLGWALDGQKLETPRVEVRYRKSEGVVLEEGFVPWAEEHAPELLNYGAPKPVLNEIRARLKNGQKVPYALLETRQNMSIK